MSTRWICCVECFTGERLAFPETLVVISFDCRRAKILATCEENRLNAQKAMIRAQYQDHSDDGGGAVDEEAVNVAIARQLGKIISRVKRIKAAEAIVMHHDKRMFVRAVTHVDTWEKMVEFTRSGELEAPSKELEGFTKKDAGWATGPSPGGGEVDIDVEHENPKPGDVVDESGNT